MYPDETADRPSPGVRLNLTDLVEVERWSKLLDLDPGDLKQAARIVGPDYGDLVAHLADKPN